MSKTAKVAELPTCAWCSGQAQYDFKTISGQWAYGCGRHWGRFRLYDELGTGKGQRLVVES